MEYIYIFTQRREHYVRALSTCHQTYKEIGNHNTVRERDHQRGEKEKEDRTKEKRHRHHLIMFTYCFTHLICIYCILFYCILVNRAPPNIYIFLNSILLLLDLCIVVNS